jgi:2-dehydropantoate 2-reductase
MAFVVLGAGAVGAVVGARLHQAGHEVTLLARGAHRDALRARGLRLESPAGAEILTVPAAGDPSEVTWRQDHVVLLAVKSQHTQAALNALAEAAPSSTPIVCLQNGIANEPAALRLFASVYGVSVACPASYLQPGLVQAWSTPVTGLLDVGRYPDGTDQISEHVARAFASATFDAHSIGDIRRWKHRKLLTNLGNAIEAVCGPHARRGRLGDLLTAEGEAVLSAAGLEAATAGEDRARRADLLRLGQIGGATRPGGSSWQSVRRRVGDIETDYLNGEIVLLGRLHAIATPANELIQQLARECATGHRPPCSVSESDILDRLDRAS